MTKRVLSGIRPTGQLHLGNYLGAVKGMVELQDNPEYETFYMVVDVHALTTPHNPDELRKYRRGVIIDYLAAGLDPEKSILFLQSDVSEHIELAFYLSSVTTIAKMQHLPTFKEKVKQHPENATMALLNYPTLMAADILLYGASLVPVGIDQEPHIEATREIARKFNQQYGTNFPEPQRFATSGEYVPSLTGEGKMSKTVSGSYVGITDDLETIRRQVMSAPTDSGQGSEVPVEGGVANLLKLVELIQGQQRRQEYEGQYLGEGVRYGELKEELSQAIYDYLNPFQEKRRAIEADQTYVDRVIAEGAEKAGDIARETINDVKTKLGLA